MACIDPHQTGFAGKGSDHLQLLKFWPSRAPGKGVCGGAKIFGSALLQPARSVCVSLNAFFICLRCYCCCCNLPFSDFHFALKFSRQQTQSVHCIHQFSHVWQDLQLQTTS